jgi:hypothetical protein
MGVGGQRHAPAALPPRKTRCPLFRSGQVWASGPVLTFVENLAPPGFDPRTVHPVVSRYTNYAVPALRMYARKYLRMYARMLTITTRPNRRVEFIEAYKHFLLIYKCNILGPLDICLSRSLS